jgi:hypothetical protein
MQRRWLLTLFGVFAFCVTTMAQKANTDSLSLVSKVSADQLKLAKLQNQVDDKTKDKKETAEQAQKSANDNTEAANKLSSNPQDKSLARKADRSASDARRDAKRARKAADNLDDLNKDIQKLNDKIAKENSKLNQYGQPAAPVMTQWAAPVATPVKTDTTQHR